MEKGQGCIISNPGGPPSCRVKLIAARMEMNIQSTGAYMGTIDKAAIEFRDFECRIMKRGDWLGKPPRTIDPWLLLGR